MQLSLCERMLVVITDASSTVVGLRTVQLRRTRITLFFSHHTGYYCFCPLGLCQQYSIMDILVCIEMFETLKHKLYIVKNEQPSQHNTMHS